MSVARKLTQKTLRIYRALLALYPAEFRNEYCREFCLTFEDRCRASGTPLGIVAIAIHSALGILAGAPKEHIAMLIQDIRHAARVLRKDFLVTLTAIIVLGLGIGSTTIVFSLANAILIRPLPYPRADRIVAVQEMETSAGESGFGCCEVAYPNYVDMRTRTRLLEDLGEYDEGLATIRGEGTAERIQVASFTDAVFNILGVQPLMGRTFTKQDDLPHGPKVVVLSEDLWRSRYGGDPNILGRVIDIGGARSQVIGVMPASFHFPQIADAWLPLHMDPAKAVRTDHFLNAIAQLKPGVSVAQASEEMKSIMAQINRENPATTYQNTARAIPLRSVLAGNYRTEVITLLGAAGLLLLIACANITNLLLVKATARAREMAVRTALGASRSRLIRQLITESLCLGILGGAAGLALTYAGLPALLRLIPIRLPAWMHFDVDLRVLAFVIGASLLTSVIFGVAPAFGTSRIDPSLALHDFARGGTQSRARKLLRNTLVVSEVALSLVLLVGAGLMMRSFAALRGQDLGYDTSHVLTFYMSTPGYRYTAGEKSLQLLEQIRGQIGALPTVKSVAFASGIPLEAAWGRSLTVEGFPVLALKDAPLINHTITTPGYFAALGIPLLEGRDFAQADFQDPMVTIVDANLAKHYWPHESAVGKRIRFGPPEDNEPWHTIVGVVASVMNQTLTSVDRWNTYIPFDKTDGAGMSVIIRTTGDPGQLVAGVRARLSQLDRDIAMDRVYTLDQVIDRTAWQQRFFAILFVVFASLATVLVAAGLYGVLAYSVSLRTGEIGIRMALGASGSAVQRMILRQGLALVELGLAIGFAGAIAFTRVLSSQLYHVSSTDPKTYAGVAVLFALVALAACWIPSHRATRIDPIICLRSE